MKKFYSLLITLLLGVMMISAQEPDKGLYFDGSQNSYIDVPNTSALPTAFTLEMWVNFEKLGVGDSYVVNTEGYINDAHVGFVLRKKYETNCFELGVSGEPAGTISSTQSLEENKWYHFAITNSGNEWEFFIDGVSQGKITATMAPSGKLLRFGEGAEWTNRRFVGILADIRFWGTVRTQDQIKASMANIFELKGDEPGLITNSKLNENGGNVIGSTNAAFNIDKTKHTVLWYPSEMKSGQEPDKGLYFDGSENSYIDVPNTSELPPAFSLEMWVNFKNLATGDGYIVSTEGWDDPNQANQGFLLRRLWGTNRYELVVGVGTGEVKIQSEQALQEDKWYHFAITNSGTEWEFYIDGVSQGKAAGALVQSGKLLRFGEGTQWMNRRFNGILSDIRFWGTVRTQDDIKASMANTFGLKGDEGGLITNSKLNENGGDVIGSTNAAFNIDKTKHDVFWYPSEMRTGQEPDKGLYFDGSENSYIDVPNTSELPPAFSLEMWVNFKNLATGDGYIVSTEGWDDPNQANQGFLLRRLWGTNRYELVVGVGTGEVKIQSEQALQEDKWYHFAITNSGTEWEFYIDGVSQGKAAGALVQSGKLLRFGEGTQWTNRRFNGILSDIRFWGTVRTQDEVKASMATTFGLNGDEGGLITNSKLNENGGDVIGSTNQAFNIDKTKHNVFWYPSEMKLGQEPDKGLYFDGSENSYIDVPNTSELPPAFSLEMWVNFKNLATGDGYIVSTEGWDDTNKNKGFLLRRTWETKRYELVVGIGTEGEIKIFSEQALEENKWYHFAITNSGTEWEFYIDGVSQGKAAGVLVQSGKEIRFGEGTEWMNRRFNGIISDVRFWGTVRTKDEIKASMANTFGLNGDEGGLITNSKLNENEGDVIGSTNPAFNIDKTKHTVWWYPSEIGTQAKEELKNSPDIEVYFVGNELQVTNKTSSNLNVSIYSMLGQKIFNGNVKAGNQFHTQLNNLQGAYIIKCYAEDGATFTKKFIVK